MKVDLSGKVALVTGAARGIGQSIADMMTENGARVVYTDIIPIETNVLNYRAMTMDVRDEAQVKEVVAAIVKEFGQIDILVNNAGINTLHHRVPIDEFPREEWDKILDVDLTGLYLVSKEVGAVMRLRGEGRIINIASVVGLVPLRLQCAFVAAKAGVVNLTKSMAMELGSAGINVNCIAPGSILTEGTKDLFYGENGKFKESVQSLIDHIPQGRPGRPEEIAAAALFLAAPEASYVNGAILTVDGGWLAGYVRDF
ncbi:MAG: SDR family oxidoreductase [Pirellulales bacterium]|nr:SDR family oxidoreductase [Pirellulales bacterium]